ncbi:MAG: cytochrome c oxidase assembly protein [Polymorphobacter sp.]
MTTHLAPNPGRRRTALAAAAFALAMLALAYAAVPLYKLFCQVTGFGGTTQRSEAGVAPLSADANPTGRVIKVRFDANTAPGMPWQFAPEANSVTIPIGARRLAFYKATNMTAAATTGRATFNVSPDTAGKYFVKIDCFCFTEQTLKAGETVDMPVSYYIDPAILKDKDAARIDEITLSYTFFPVDADDAQRLEAKSVPKG